MVLLLKTEHSFHAGFVKNKFAVRHDALPDAYESPFAEETRLRTEFSELPRHCKFSGNVGTFAAIIRLI